MKTTRKLLLVLAVFAACALLFAATALADNPTVDNNTVTFSKSITLFNEIEGYYYGPSVTYTYLITPADDEDLALVTDSQGNSANIQKGPANSVSFTSSFTPCKTDGSITFTSNEQHFSENGDSYAPEGGATLHFNMEAFETPGVYRYVLTDNTAATTLNAAGIVRSADYDDELYLDVYVENDGNGLKVSNAVLVTGDDNPVTSETAKTDGFDDDEYHTYNVTITKTVTGGMGDKTNEFQFRIDVINNPASADGPNMTYYAAKNTVPTTTDNKTDKELTVGMKDQDVYYIYGLNPKATVNVTETNDTSETYNVSVNGANGAVLLPKTPVAPTARQTMTQDGTAKAVTDYPTSEVPHSVAQTNVKQIDFTNEYESVSPTGLALRYGPFVLLLAGAVCFFIVGRKRKETKEESDSI